MYIPNALDHISGFIYFTKIFLIDLLAIFITSFLLINYLKYNNLFHFKYNNLNEGRENKYYEDQINFLENHLADKLDSVKDNGIIEILGIDLWDFVNVDGFFAMVKKAIERGIRFRILLLNPLSSIKEYVPMNKVESGYRWGDDEKYNSDEFNIIRTWEYESKKSLKDKYDEYFQIIIYDDIPEYLMINLNGEEMIICPFLRSGNAEGGPCIEFHKEDATMFKAHMSHLVAFLESSKSIPIEKFKKNLENEEAEKANAAR